MSEYLQSHLEKYSKEIQEGEKSIVDNTIEGNLPLLHTFGIPVDEYLFDIEDFENYLKAVDYPETFPRYTQTCHIEEKSFQHYLSLKIMDVNENDLVVDIASSNSPFSLITRQYHPKVTVYRQDMQYPLGVNDDKIGGNADTLPLEEESVNSMVLHCSLEHFEDESDIRFFHEAARVLKKGGVVCVTPLYLSSHKVILTSPSVWVGKYNNVVNLPEFSAGFPIKINEDIKQRQIKLFSPDELKSALMTPLADVFDFSIVVIKNRDELEAKGYTRYPKFTLIARKREG